MKIELFYIVEIVLANGEVAHYDFCFVDAECDCLWERENDSSLEISV